MQVILTTNSKKKEILKNKDPFTNIKIYTLNELTNVYPYIWNDETIDYIMNNYHVILDIAKIYLKQIIYYDVDKITDEKGLLLKTLKKDLLNKSLLKENILLKEELQSTTINITLPKETWLTNWLKDFSINYITDEVKNYNPNVYEFSSFDNELLFVTERIKDLLDKNISPQNIFLTNLESNDYNNINRVMSLANIPIKLNDTKTLAKTTLGNIFLKKLEQESIEDSLLYIKEYTDSKDNDLVNDIISTVNKYIGLKNAKEFIKKALKETKVQKSFNSYAIEEKDIFDIDVNDNNYIFLLNATSNTLPKTIKDEDFLSDATKSLIGGTTSLEKNKLIKENTLNKIKEFKNITITYSLVKDGTELYPSSLIKDFNIVKDEPLKYNVSHKLNKILLTKNLDEYTKYNVISKELKELLPYYSLPYQTYDNSFKEINKSVLNEYLKELNLSYTSIDTYNKCPFKYFVNNILKITPYEETWQIFIGNLFHKILENKDLKDWQKLYDELSIERNLTYKEKFFLDKLKKDLTFILETLSKNEEEMNLPYEIFETELKVKINDKTTLEGRIDKIKYNKVDGKTITVLIDYKTGNAKIDPSIMPLGFSLQLPIYLYLLKNTENFKNTTFGGIYFQNILPTRITYDDKKTFEFQKKENLKLHGYSNKDVTVLKYIDNHYENSKIIKGLKTKSDGEFYSYSKVLSENDITAIEELAYKYIYESTNNILNGKFPITSKIIDNKNHISCEYCTLKDICYHTNKENIYLTSDKTFLKKESDNNGLDS